MKKTFKYYFDLVTESKSSDNSLIDFVKFMGSKVRNSRYSDWSNSNYDRLKLDQQEDVSLDQKKELKRYIQPELEKLGCSENFITSFFNTIFKKDYPELFSYIEEDLQKELQKEIQKKPK
jgi:hypothetical protein